MGLVFQVLAAAEVLQWHHQIEIQMQGSKQVHDLVILFLPDPES